MNYDIFIPVRLDSSRLPNKAFKEIGGIPVIHLLIKRLSSIPKVRKIVVCTTSEKSDDVLVEYLKKNNIECYRGNKKDVLVRFLHIAEKLGTDIVINVDGDDIYTDPKHIEEIIKEFEKSNVDYVSIENLPLGLSPVAFSVSSLKKICELKITNNTETGYRRFFTDTSMCSFKKLQIQNIPEFPLELKLSLDYPEDYELAKQIFEKFGNDFNIEKLSKFFVDNPKLLNHSTNLKKWEKHWDENVSDVSMQGST